MTLADQPFHPDTRALLDYGRAIASGKSPPAIHAADKMADRLFVIDGVPDGRAQFMTFGAELIALFKRDLRRNDLLDLYLAPDRAMLKALLNAIVDANEPGVACGVAETSCGLQVGYEVVLTPLAKGVLSGERLLGLIQPLGGEGFLGGRAVVRLRLTAIFPPRARVPAITRGLRLVVSNP